jgi:hypothetical protein
LVGVGQISTGQEQVRLLPSVGLKIKGGGRAGTGRDDCVIESPGGALWLEKLHRPQRR